MTLDEAIEHARDKAKENRKDARFTSIPWHAKDCIRWAEENEQLASWLEELKELRELDIVRCKDCKHWGTGVPGETEYAKCCEYGGYMVGANGYCVYGEKECAEWVIR